MSEHDRPSGEDFRRLATRADRRELMNQVNGLNDLLSDEEFLAELRQESSEGSELERQQFSELLDKLARRLSELAGEGGEPPPPEDRPKG